MAVPKRHLSKARRDKRRSNVWKLEAPTLVKCSNCGAATAATTRARKSSRRADLHFTWWQHGCMTEGEGVLCLPLLRVSGSLCCAAAKRAGPFERRRQPWL